MLKNKKTLIIFLVLIMFITSFYLYSNLIDYLSILDKKEIYTRVIVGNKTGIDINGSSLIFGEIVPGSASFKKISIGNYYDKDVNVKIFVRGNISKYLFISENDFILMNGDEEDITFTVIIPEGVEKGVYEGKVDILIKNPLIR